MNKITWKKVWILNNRKWAQVWKLDISGEKSRFFSCDKEALKVADTLRAAK